MHDPCKCRTPPFFHGDYREEALGEDSHDAVVTLDTCRHCSTRWLHYLIEEPARTAQGRWYRVELEPDQAVPSLAEARAFIESRSSAFRGGSYFETTGEAVRGPGRIF